MEQTGKRADRLAEKLTFANKRLERLGAGASGDEEMETELKVLKVDYQSRCPSKRELITVFVAVDLEVFRLSRPTEECRHHQVFSLFLSSLHSRESEDSAPQVSRLWQVIRSR